MSISKISDHIAEAIDRLPAQMRLPNIEKLLSILVKPANELETAAWDVLTLRAIDTAVGVTLDALGTIVGQKRQGLTDEDYRRYLRARIATNKSTGRIEDVLVVSRLIINDVNAYLEIDNQGAACCVLRVRLIPLAHDVADILVSFLRNVTVGGARVIVEYTPEAPGTTFKWDTAGRGWDSGLPFVDAKD